MGTRRALIDRSFRTAARAAVAGLFVGGLALLPALVAAQETARKPADEGFFGGIARWFERQGDGIKSTFKDAGRNVENFGREAGVAAKSTAEGARDAAGAVARIPNARVVTGHEKCPNAPNGAPDCTAAAVAMCQAKGFQSGKSMDMTTAQVCPPKVLLSGRNTGTECHDETFISRAFCQ